MNILTVTLNPVIDVHYTLDDLVPGIDNEASNCVKFAAGKGVNVARELLRHGVKCSQYILLGEDNSLDYLKLLRRDGLQAKYITVQGSTREYISLNCPDKCQETRVTFKNFTAASGDVMALGSLIINDVREGDAVVLSGRFPLGVEEDVFVDLCLYLKDKGAKVIVDSASVSLESLKKIRPWLIKPNVAEALGLLKICKSGEERAVLPEFMLNNMAEELVKYSDRVILSAGPRGLLYISSDGEKYRLDAHPVERIYSTVGAGDSLVAGFLYGLSSGESTEEALETAIDFSTETCVRRR